MNRTHIHMKIGAVARDVVVTEIADGITVETELGEAHFTVVDRGSGRLLIGLPDGTVQEVLCDREGDTVHVATHGQNFRATREARPDNNSADAATEGVAHLEAPMTGRVVQVLVSDGAEVEEDEVIIVIEAMKMEHRVTTPIKGLVSDLSSVVGDQVDLGQNLATVIKRED